MGQVILQVLFLLACLPATKSLVVPTHSRRRAPFLHARPKRQSADVGETKLAEEERVDVVGSEFFGGNKQKEEFFDPIAEAEASVLASPASSDESTTYNRFADTAAFPDAEISSLARSLQQQINSILYEDTKESSSKDFVYSPSLQWNNPWQSKLKSPLAALDGALEFYRRCDVAIVGGERVSDDQIRFTWYISVTWPTFWEPRVCLSGSSVLSLKSNEIIKQVDMIDSDDVKGSVSSQVTPRFWDMYHIGMTPSAEETPRIPVKSGGPFSSYKVFELPPRLVLQPTMVDTGDRDDRNAAYIPNHAFSCVIKTMGPSAQRYVPTSPTQIQILPSSDNVQLEWSIPISVEYLTNPILDIPQTDEETDLSTNPGCKYGYQDRRQVATVTYGGDPQDAEVADIRKKLYESVVKDGLKPKLTSNGRPVFFFWQNALKTCYTDEGMGMAVYEWRPKAAKCNEIGIELEVPPGNRLAPSTD